MIEQGQVDQGLAYLSEIAERRQVSTYWVHLAVEQIALRRFELAEASCRAALSLAQDNNQAASANLTLFELYQRTGQVDQALSAWNMATVLNTGLGDLVSQVTDWLIHRGELEKARTYLARDTNPVTQVFYGGLIDWHSKRLQPARDKWRRVIQTEAGDSGPEVQAWLEASLRLGEPARVTEWAQQARSVASAAVHRRAGPGGDRPPDAREHGTGAGAVRRGHHSPPPQVACTERTACPLLENCSPCW